MSRLLIAFLLPLLAAAQLTPNTVTVTASRPSAGQADNVRFSLSVRSAPVATRDEVSAAIAGVGVAAANFTGLYSYGGESVTWNFSMTAPLSSLKSTIAVLTALQNTLETGKKYSLSFSVSGENSGSECKLQDLLADARSQAAKIASAAGMSVGAIQAITGATAGPTAGAVGIAIPSTVAAPSCSITVRFGLAGGF